MIVIIFLGQETSIKLGLLRRDQNLANAKMPTYMVTSKNCIGFVKCSVTKDIDGDDILGQETSIKLVLLWLDQK